jgi:hypothetical protein
MKKKEVDDVVGGQGSWDNVDKMDGEASCLLDSYVGEDSSSEAPELPSAWEL